MPNEQAAEGVAQENTEVVQPQQTQSVDPSSDVAKTPEVENSNSLNDAQSESTKASTADGDTDWKNELQSKVKNADAESMRRKAKNKELTSKLERAEAKIAELEGNKPTLESVGGDYDALQRAEQGHGVRQAIAEDKLSDAKYEAKAIAPDKNLEDIKTASDGYFKSIEPYFNKQDSVSTDAYQAKQSIFNEALTMRPTSDQAMIINELAAMGADAAEVVMNMADNPKALHDMAFAKTPFQAAQVLFNAKAPVARQSESHAVIPEIGGSSGAVNESYDMDTFEGIRKWKKAGCPGK
jgi:hypothetical protein